MEDRLFYLFMAFLLIAGFGIGFIVGTWDQEKANNPYDVNRDGEVTATDYILIKNYIMEVQDED